MPQPPSPNFFRGQDNGSGHTEAAVKRIALWRPRGPGVLLVEVYEFRIGGTSMKRLIVRLWKEEEGQDLTEYALLLTLISLALVASLQGLATALNTIFGNASTTLT